MTLSAKVPAKAAANLDRVKAVLGTMEGVKPEAEAAAKILDELFGLHYADGSQVNIRDYVTGDVFSDASLLRTLRMHEALAAGLRFEKVVEVLYEAAKVAGGIVGLFI